ncbi:MAG: thiamine phosphate synthase [Deltaproteobacteria bacterium]|nr:MAG: thiamine phosphate synthase [Deltaproteobacteria bacterium]
MAFFPETDLYCITDYAHSNGRTNIEVVRKMIDSGIKIIQYREKSRSMREKLEECRIIRTLTKEAGVLFIVNDHIDLALLSEADGVHIGQDDLPASEVRKLTGNNKIIGISTHSPEQALGAEKEGVVDYIGAGPVFRTYTKKDVCEPVGLEFIDFVSSKISLPFVAIGGIKEHNISDVLSHGAKCFALVTEITGADSIEEKILNLRNKLRNKGYR